jgi:hypothetical protein
MKIKNKSTPHVVRAWWEMEKIHKICPASKSKLINFLSKYFFVKLKCIIDKIFFKYINLYFFNDDHVNLIYRLFHFAICNEKKEKKISQVSLKII